MKMKGGCVLYLIAVALMIISIFLMIKGVRLIWEWLQTLDLPEQIRFILIT